MAEQGRCPQCGRELSGDAPAGLCPACLMRRGLESNTVGEGPSSRWQPPSATELAGSFPELEILELIGRGGMGAVYKVRQKELGRLAALKILPPAIGADPSFAQRFAREAQAMARLSHPHIVTIYDFGQRPTAGKTGEPRGEGLSDTPAAGGETLSEPSEPKGEVPNGPRGLYFFLMEYVDGLSLRQVLDAGGLGSDEALAIVPQICDALQYAHDRGIVHRDIKPENILLSREGQVKIADFGLAKLVAAASPGGAEEAADAADQAHARPGSAVDDVTLAGGRVIGTPQYMAPEQRERPGEVDHRADIYSLGVVFYQMLTGELPAKAIQPPSRKVLIDVRLDEVVLRALEAEPSRRYQQVSQVRTELETIVATSNKGPSPSIPHVPTVSSGLADRSGGSRLSRLVVLGLIWAPFAVIAFWASSYGVRVPADAYEGPQWWQLLLRFTVLPLGVTAPFGTTICGIIAVSRIRHSAGRLHGLGLALFDALLFPLLALDVLIVYCAIELAVMIDFSAIDSDDRTIGLIAGLVICGLADFFIVRGLWRAARRPVEPVELASQEQRSPRRSNAWKWAIGLVTLILLVVVVGWFIMDQRQPVNHERRRGLQEFVVAGGVVAARDREAELERELAAATRKFGPKHRETLRIQDKLAEARKRLNALEIPASPPASDIPGVPPTVQAAAGSWQVTLPSGVKVELLGVGDHYSQGQPRPAADAWWRPNGTMMRGEFFPAVGASVSEAGGQWRKEFAACISGLSGSDYSVVWQVEPSRSIAGGAQEYRDGSALHAIAARIPASARRVTVRVGVAAGPWSSRMTTANYGGNSSVGTGEEGATFSPPYEQDGQAVISVAYKLQGDLDVRVVAIDVSGRVYQPVKTHAASAEAPQITARFEVPLAEIEQFQLQSRPYEWAEFGNIELFPSGGLNDGRNREATITGRVLDSEGQPVVGAYILPLPHGGYPAETGADGRFSLVGSDSERQISMLIIRAPRRGLAAVLKLYGRHDAGDIVLSPSALICGHVVDQDGQPLPRVSVSPLVHPWPGMNVGFGYTSWPGGRSTDSRGGFVFNCLPTGLKYSLSAGGAGYESTAFDVGEITQPGKHEYEVVVKRLSETPPASTSQPATQPAGTRNDGGVPVGQVIERTVYDDGVGRDFFIDLETGRLFSPTREQIQAMQQAYQRNPDALRTMLAEGWDAMCDTRSSGPGLYGFEMIVLPFPSQRWDTATPEQLADEMASCRAGTPALMTAEGELPKTYAFQTREGSIGLLQILELVQASPKHVNIRYKLLRRGDADPGATSPVTQPVKDPKDNTFEIHISGADLRGVTKLLSDQSGRSIVLLEGVRGVVDLDLLQVTFDQALDAVVRSAGYVYAEKDGVIYVGTPEQVAPFGTLRPAPQLSDDWPIRIVKRDREGNIQAVYKAQSWDRISDNSYRLKDFTFTQYVDGQPGNAIHARQAVVKISEEDGVFQVESIDASEVQMRPAAPSQPTSQPVEQTAAP